MFVPSVKKKIMCNQSGFLSCPHPSGTKQPLVHYLPSFVANVLFLTYGRTPLANSSLAVGYAHLWEPQLFPSPMHILHLSLCSLLLSTSPAMALFLVFLPHWGCPFSLLHSGPYSQHPLELQVISTLTAVGSHKSRTPKPM